MRWTRCVVGVAVAACSADAHEPPAATCAIRIESSSVREDFIYELVSPGRPATQTLYRDGVVQSYWTYTYDGAGRLIAETQDCCGGTPSGPDGIVDHEIRYEHTPTSSIARSFAQGFDTPTDSAEMTLDERDRITRLTHGKGMETTGIDAFDYVLDDDGAVLRREVTGTDIDLGPYTRIDTYRYEAGRMVAHGATDTRGGGMLQVSFAYEAQPDHLVLTRTTPSGTGSRSIYSYDRAGRLTRIEAAEQLAGPIVVVADFAYNGDEVTASLTREMAAPARTYAYSSACAFQPTAPKLPTSGTRPGTSWEPTPYPFLLSPLE